ncbi:probable E3 ubiquitin-protein ligase ZFP1 [Nymphaea colorata]|nr:probable E3 ubiquitin-protein ligase ZFP1 [Nymphaea colorata]XP_031491002.1 probable E3 ubiquitin-protein ligase ZFP1 [Nymphaea colorata]XP_031491012.1 probable E3 ubiquitin-protein ligase ZFP1 [Nymphaea colorata]XP_031491019.1 probable E3 ubiquitin-protein ligase ZFP1 [Nymphaea colorata]XP_031491028.1 probable E3 ubiquitin-protein ligase ZFP1 [Nymphaea colorata]XP_031491038.1 probable E3 ubiquitin-protein ligase ZFP1 [Nymphaea colorata]
MDTSQKDMFSPQALDTEIGPSHRYIQSEPCMILGTNFPNQNSNNTSLLPSGDPSGLDLDYVRHANNSFYSNHYSHHPQTIPCSELSRTPTSFLQNINNRPYVIHTTAHSVFPSPLNPSSHLASSSSSGAFGAGMHHYPRSTDLVDTGRGSCKRKSEEAPLGSCYPVGAPSSSSSSGANTNFCQHQSEDPSGTIRGVCNLASINQSEHMQNSNAAVSGGSQRSVRSRSGSIRACTDQVIEFHSQFLQGNHMDQSPPSGSDGAVAQLSSNGDGGNSSWSRLPVPPGLHRRMFASSGVSASGGHADIGNVVTQGYQGPLFGRIPTIVWHTSPMHHLPPHAMQPIIGDNGYRFYAPVLTPPAPPNRESTNPHLHQNMQNTARGGVQIAPARYMQVLQPSGERIPRTQRRTSYEQTPRFPRNNNHMRFAMLSSQNLAMLDFSGFYDSGELVDQYRDMRLDIDNMSYEELLALEERIGNVKTGLSEESISKCMKIRKHVSCECSSRCNGCRSMTSESGRCIICQEEYKAEDEIGSLQCGHDYHAACIKQWLLIKNLCPICKVNALTADEK